MRKRFLNLMFVILIVSMLCVSLVVCKDNNKPNPEVTSDKDTIKFTDSMSSAEILEQLGKVENFTMNASLNEEAYITYYLGTDFCYIAYSEDGEMEVSYEFIEDNRVYEFNFYYGVDEDDNYENVNVTDFTGYDIDFNSAVGTKSLVDDIMSASDSDEFSIFVENGNVKIELVYTEDDETITYVYILKDFNTTSMPELPEEYKDYKTLEVTNEAVRFSLSSNDAWYSVSYLHSYIISYEVLEEYNGKPVIFFDVTCYSSNLKTITLPTSIVALSYSGCYHDAEDGELHIIYKGTKAQWENIENSDIWSKTEGVRITCSDGDYVVTEE